MAPDSKPNDPNRKALLIGSISPVSSAAFVAFSECVLRAQPWVVDPVAGNYKQRHGNFIKADGLSLPEEWEGSVHTVVTNCLLHMLRNADGQLLTASPAAEQETLRTFAWKMFRLLQTGGRLLLCERPPQLSTQDPNCREPYNQGVVADFADRLQEALPKPDFQRSSLRPGRGQETPASCSSPSTPQNPRR